MWEKNIVGKIVIVSNNSNAFSQSARKYDGKAEVIYLKDKSANDVFRKVMELLLDGARLSSPDKIKHPERPQQTVTVFYGDVNAPIKHNVDQIQTMIDAS